jgi:hypothetical protein
MFVYIIIFLSVVKASFLLDNEGWTIVGNKNIIAAIHKPYSLGSEMSNYILGTDNLVNVDSNNKNDRNLWYFRSPKIHLMKQPAIMVFTITSFSGDFNKLNSALPVVKIIDYEGRIASFYKAIFDGRMQKITVPFFEELWSSDLIFKVLFKHPFIIEILGDWTQGVETVAIDNLEFYYTDRK